MAFSAEETVAFSVETTGGDLAVCTLSDGETGVFPAEIVGGALVGQTLSDMIYVNSSKLQLNL